MSEITTKPTQASKKAWLVCKGCGKARSLFEMWCPHCISAGKSERSETSVDSGAEYPLNFRTYPLFTPKGWTYGGVPVECLKCFVGRRSGTGLCDKAGEIFYTCPSDDFQVCPCKACCVAAKNSARKKTDSLPVSVPASTLDFATTEVQK